MQSQLQSLRDLALEANNATESPHDLSAIATQATQIQKSLLSLANTQDGSGNYIFAGFSTQTQPFALDARPARPTAAIRVSGRCRSAAGQTVVVGDNGDLVFNQIKTGNGTFNVTAASRQYRHRASSARPTVTDPAGLHRRAPIPSISPPRMPIRW